MYRRSTLTEYNLILVYHSEIVTVSHYAERTFLINHEIVGVTNYRDVYLSYGVITRILDRWTDERTSQHHLKGIAPCITTRFSNGNSRVFFSRRRIGSKQCHCHIRQTICSTRFGARVCLLIVWCKHFQPPLYSLPKFKIVHCKMRFFVKIAHFL